MRDSGKFLKPYKINIEKEQVFFDVDSITHKMMDINETDKMKGYAVRTDEGIQDREMMIRMADKLDADVRVMLQRYLYPPPEDIVTEVDSSVSDAKGKYSYHLKMPFNWNPELLVPLARYIHEYLVYGILWRYYKNNLPDWARTISLDDIGESIKDLTSRREGGVRRPLQPF